MCVCVCVVMVCACDVCVVFIILRCFLCWGKEDIMGMMCIMLCLIVAFALVFATIRTCGEQFQLILVQPEKVNSERFDCFL